MDASNQEKHFGTKFERISRKLTKLWAQTHLRKWYCHFNVKLKYDVTAAGFCSSAWWFAVQCLISLNLAIIFKNNQLILLFQFESIHIFL